MTAARMVARLASAPGYPGRGGPCPGKVVLLAGTLDPLPNRGERADRVCDQAGQRGRSAPAGAWVRQRFQPLQHRQGQILAAGIAGHRGTVLARSRPSCHER
jgi:hypothetical protein